MDDPDYRSGDDVVVEFIGHRYAFSAKDFRERVVAAGVRLGLAEARDLEGDAADDLVTIAATGSLDAPRSEFGQYVQRHWDEIEGHGGESLVYWLRKLVFRGAWLDHRVKLGLLDVAFDDEVGEFHYRLPGAEPPPVELATHPSWLAVRYAGR